MTLLVARPGRADEGIVRDIGPQLASYGAVTDPERRLEILQGIESLLGGRDTARSPELSLLLLPILDDESEACRRIGVRLLGSYGVPETAVPRLRDLCEDLVCAEKELWKAVDASKMPTPEKILEAPEAALEILGKRLRETERAVELAGKQLSLQNELVESLSCLRDDRSVEALGILAETQPPWNETLREALLRFGTRRALGHVAAMVRRGEDIRKERETGLRKARSERSGRPPRGRTNEQWLARERVRIQGLVDRAQKGIDGLDERMETVCARLRAFGEENGLRPAPVRVVPYGAWASWLRWQAPALPASVAEAAGE
jgi:hypothetical protein